MATRSIHPKPDVAAGIDYWQGVESTVDGVLGGYGLGTLPRVDALGSRTFLLSVLPRLSAIAPVTDDPQVWKKAKLEERGGKGKMKTRALDCGAGVGRVSENVLSKIVDEVHLVEPVRKFLVEAARLAPNWPSLSLPPSKSPLFARKSAHFHVSTLQALDPARPWSTADGGIYLKQQINGEKVVKRARKDEEQIAPVFSPDEDGSRMISADDEELNPKEPLQYDIVLCQWMLQHLDDTDLKAFLARARACLKDDGIIFVKENVCQEQEDGSENVWYDEEDKSITRSALAYERVFKESNLRTVRCEVQHGLPEELFVVKMWALR